MQVITSFQMVTEESSEAGLPLIIEGYIMDADDDYVYMGSDGDEIRQAVSAKHVVFVQILEKTDQIEEMFSGLPKVKKRDMN